jgi:hypothetical protein
MLRLVRICISKIATHEQLSSQPQLLELGEAAKEDINRRIMVTSATTIRHAFDGGADEILTTILFLRWIVRKGIIGVYGHDKTEQQPDDHPSDCTY